jgi:hypothetical protein
LKTQVNNYLFFKEWGLQVIGDSVQPSQDMVHWVDTRFEAEGDAESVVGDGDAQGVEIWGSDAQGVEIWGL